ncbi:hypothetical protein B0O99DRAFT_593058 [Bisporella sp. PMI_857]|nr:hypothetical protein B0O99DRAFT_593058 [Bisporella sp. PMI_857]
MKLFKLLLYGVLARTALACSDKKSGVGSAFPTAENPCSIGSSFSRWKINNTADTQLMTACAKIHQTLWISNDYPGVPSLPSLVDVGGIYVGDVFYQGASQSIASGTLTGVSLPALTSAFEILAVNLDSFQPFDVPKLVGVRLSPTLTGVGLSITLEGLPSLKNFTFSDNYDTQYITITNTGLTDFNFPSPKHVFSIKLVGNPDLEKVTFSSNGNVTYLTVDCGSIVKDLRSKPEDQCALPRFSGPAALRNLEVAYCNPPAGDARTAFDSVGKIAFPQLTTAESISVVDNIGLNFINESAFSALKNVSQTSTFEGDFTAIALPPLLEGGFLNIDSTPTSFNCSIFEPYSSYNSPSYVSGLHITVTCTHPYSYSSGSSGGGGGGGGGAHAKFKPRIIHPPQAQPTPQGPAPTYQYEASPPIPQAYLDQNKQVPVSPVSAMSEVPPDKSNGAVATPAPGSNENLAQTQQMPTSTTLSREEMLYARERALQERERQLEQEALNEREVALAAREREIRCGKRARGIGLGVIKREI